MGDWLTESATPRPCSRCGRLPKLRERSYYYLGTGPLLYERWYECRRWCGLRLCQRGETHTNEKTWADLATRYAGHKWNAACATALEQGERQEGRR